MKKKILFVIPSLHSGGAEKNLTTLLTLFDYSKYDVDLYIFRKEGLFLEAIPQNIRVFEAGENYNVFDGSSSFAIKFFLKKLRPDLAVLRYKYGISQRQSDKYKRDSDAWKYLRRVAFVPQDEYDCVIGYLEGVSNCFAADFIKTKKRIGYLHSYMDFDRQDNRFFSQTICKFDYFVTVSKECLAALEKAHPDYKNFKLIHNIISPTIINSEAKKEPFKFDTDKTSILTVGRLVEEKGPDFAVEACRLLRDRGLEFKWYHIGKGKMRDELQAKIDSCSLGDYFEFLGERSNPYPYIAACDIYAQPSRNEGKSIAVDEAKCLNKPIVVTDFPSVFDQIENGKNGSICRRDPQSIADALEELIKDPQKREALTFNLSQETNGNEYEMQNLYDLIEG